MVIMGEGLTRLLILLACFVFLTVCVPGTSYASKSIRVCASGCTCSTVKRDKLRTDSVSSSKRGGSLAARCRWSVTLTTMDEALSSILLPTDIVHLDLSGNSINQVTNYSFALYDSLERLSLSGNQIEIIADDAFANLSNLKLLNLSDNNLRLLRNSSFAGLENLEKLILAGNQLSRLGEGVFVSLVFLKFIDVARNPLICDCRLRWIVNWTATYHVQVSHRTTCKFPLALKGFRLHKVNKSQWHCNWPLQIPTFELRPRAPQMVFTGDSLQMHCVVSNVEASGHLSWLLDDQDVESNNTDNVTIHTELSADGDLVLSSLSVEYLRPLHQGTWTCHLDTSMGNQSRMVDVHVISTDTPYCPPIVTSNNKGRYAWPQALAGVTAELPCDSPSPLPSIGRKAPRATQACDEGGEWHSLDTAECPYVSEVTKVLEQFAKTDLSIARISIIENMQRLRNYTGNGSMLHDKMDLVYITKTIYKYLEFVPKHKEIGEVVIDLVAMIMQLNHKLLLEAQLEDRSCSRLVEALERLSELTSEGILRYHRDSVAVEDFIIKVESFSGISCASYVHGSSPSSSRYAYRSRDVIYKKFYRCEVGSAVLPPVDRVDEILETSIRLPPSLFHHTEILPSAFGHKLQFTFYHDSSLFPRAIEASQHMDVVSSVVGSHIPKYAVVNLTDPVTVTLRTPVVSGKVIPVWWDFDANGKRGDWSGEGCKLRSIYGNLVSFDCDRLANFGLLQDAELLAVLRARSKGGKFRLCHPVIYVGSIIGVSCLLLAIITYILGFRLIHLSKKNKHALTNVWISLTLLCLVFTLAVRYTEDARVCQGIGLALHYLSLVVIFWFLVMASNILKKVARDELFELPSDEPPPDHPPPPKPMIRFYLVGWGIPVIICGISGAVNMEDYAGHQYCFLAITHSVGAIYVPFGILVLLISIYYLLIYCTICRTVVEADRQMGGSSAVDGTEIEMVNIQGIDRASVEHVSVNSGKPPSSCNSNEDDVEHSATVQLRAQAFQLMLFFACWTCGALAVSEPFPSIVPYGELLFGSLYALLFSGFGAFVVIFHCVCREDILIVWKILYRCRASGLVRETQPLPHPLALNSSTQRGGGDGGGGGATCRSDDSMDSSYTNKSCSTNPSECPGAGMRKSKFCNLNAAVANAGGVTDTSWSGEMFYNPYQNGVARKFFRKHCRRNVQHHGKGADGIELKYGNRGFGKSACGKNVVVESYMRPSVNLNLPVCPKKISVKASRVMCRDRSVDSQLVSSSSQGLVSISPSHSGNCSDRSLLIVEEEEGEVDDDEPIYEEVRRSDEDPDRVRTGEPENGDASDAAAEAVGAADIDPSVDVTSAIEEEEEEGIQTNGTRDAETCVSETECTARVSSDVPPKSSPFRGEADSASGDTLCSSSTDQSECKSLSSKKPVYSCADHSCQPTSAAVSHRSEALDSESDSFARVVAELRYLKEDTVAPSMLALQEPTLKKETAV